VGRRELIRAGGNRGRRNGHLGMPRTSGQRSWVIWLMVKELDVNGERGRERLTKALWERFRRFSRQVCLLHGFVHHCSPILVRQIRSKPHLTFLFFFLFGNEMGSGSATRA